MMDTLNAGFLETSRQHDIFDFGRFDCGLGVNSGEKRSDVACCIVNNAIVAGSDRPASTSHERGANPFDRPLPPGMGRPQAPARPAAAPSHAARDPEPAAARVRHSATEAPPRPVSDRRADDIPLTAPPAWQLAELNDARGTADSPSDQAVRVSFWLHVLSYPVVLVGLYLCIEASALAGFSSGTGFSLGLAALLLILAQVTGAVQFLRTDGPPGTVPTHLRALMARIRAQR